MSIGPKLFGIRIIRSLRELGESLFFIDFQEGVLNILKALEHTKNLSHKDGIHKRYINSTF